MYKLFIDDLRSPLTNDFEIVCDYRSAIQKMEIDGCPFFVSFDHDLGIDNNEVELTAFDIVNWIIEKDIDNNGSFLPPNFSFKVHSANIVGSVNIESKLNNYLKFKLENKTNKNKFV